MARLVDRRRTRAESAGRWLPVWPAVLCGTSVLIMVATALNAPDAYRVLPLPLQLTHILVGLVVTLRAGLQRGVDRATRRPWLLLTAGWGANLAGLVCVVGAFTIDPGRIVLPLLWGGVLAGAAQVVPTMVAVLSFPVRPMQRGERIRFWLDMTTVLGGGFMFLWYLIIAPALDHRRDPVILVALGQPMLSLVLIFAVCAVMMRGAVTSLRHPLPLLLAGLCMNFLANLVLSVLLVNSPDGQLRHPLPVDVAVLIGGYLMITAAVVQLRRRRSSDRVGVPAPELRRASRLPYVAVFIGYGLLIVVVPPMEVSRINGLIAGAVVMTFAVAVRQMIALRENHDLVVRDGLTGLASRRQFETMLHRGLAAGERAGWPVGVLMIDLNGFKQVNDRYGHAAGDALLAGFADLLRTSVRRTDVAGRLGGDEFAVVLPGVTDEAATVLVADKLLRACRDHPLLVAGERFEVRASIGAAVSRPDAPLTADDLMRQADLAMYDAKRRRSATPRLYTADLDRAHRDELPPGALAELDQVHRRIAEHEERVRELRRRAEEIERAALNQPA